jgi:hypothetical protein
MPLTVDEALAIDWFWKRLRDVESPIQKSKAVFLNKEADREGVREFVKEYFSDVQPAFVAAGLKDTTIDALDFYAQDLIRLANGKSRRRTYLKHLKDIRTHRPEIDTAVARSGYLIETPPEKPPFSDIEQKILSTLQQLIPSAAMSYHQVLEDFRQPRISLRGTAAELREVLREVLDQLAPDADVSAQPGFKLENGQFRPTMKQKTLFVLRARDLPRNAIRPAENSVDMADELSARMARSVYEKGSIATHVLVNKDEVARVKHYIDGALIELLQIAIY